MDGIVKGLYLVSIAYFLKPRKVQIYTNDYTQYELARQSGSASEKGCGIRVLPVVAWVCI